MAGEWMDGAGAKVNLALFGALLGVVLPWALGLPFLDPLVIVCVSCSAVVFVAAVAGQAGREVNPDTLLPWLLVITAWGGFYGTLVVAAGIVTVNVLNWHGTILVPGALTSITTPLLPVAMSAFFTAEGFHLARKGHKPEEIGARFRWGVLILVMGAYFRHSLLPTVATEWLARRSTTPGIAMGVVLLSLALAGLAARRLRNLRLGA